MLSAMLTAAAEIPTNPGDSQIPRSPRLHSSTLRAARLAMVAGLILGIGGCKVGPNYERPDASLPDEWSKTGESETGSNREIATDWWRQFNDPTLDRLIDEALRENLTLEAAGTRVLQARAARGITAAEFFPQVQQLNAGIDNNRISESSVSGTGDRSFATSAISLDAVWELDFWGKYRRAIESSDAVLLATVADYQAVMVSLLADVASSYIQMRSFQERLALARENVKLQTETLELTRARFRAGAVSEFDVAIAQALLSNTQALIPELEDGLTKSRLSLCALLGRAPSDLVDLITPTGSVPAPPLSIAAGVPAELLRRRPDVRVAERQAAAASALIGVAKADLFPAISIVGSTGFGASNYEFGTSSASLDDIFSASAFQGFVGLRVSVPFLDYGRRENQVRVQDARFQEAVANYKQVVVNAAADVEAGLSTFLRASEQVGSLQSAVDAQQRSVDISLIQYRAGGIGVLQVNFTQTDLVTQQDALAVARASRSLGAVRAFRALGGGWESRDPGEFVSKKTAEEMRARTNWGDMLGPEYEGGQDVLFDRPRADAADSTAPSNDQQP
jgi:NodT family efflux transporter outer membrane factor (OMF) lipoprotein